MNAFLKCYLQIQLLLVAAFIIFKICRIFISKTGMKPSYQSITRSAQILMISSLIIPIIFAMIPDRNIPRLKLEFAQPVAEALSFSKSKASAMKPHPAVPLDIGLNANKEFSLQNILQMFANFDHPELLFILLFGFMLMVVRLSKNIYSIHKIICEGVIIRKLGRVVVLISDSISVPFSTLIGFRAYAVVPSSLLHELKDFRLAIQHEFQHHRQLDTAWSLLIEFWICLFYANPAVYLWKKEISELQEFSCDEALIGQRGVLSHDYGSCLIKVAEAALANRQTLVGTACVAAATKNSRYFKSLLRRRIEMFTVHESLRRKKSIAIALGTLSIIATVAVAYGAQQVLRSTTHALPNPGVATFDPTVQSIAEDVLSKAVLSYGAKGGFVLVSDPNTGKLLAAANVSNVPTRVGHAWSLSYLLEPASVMKGIVTASAVENKLTTLDEVLDCENGKYLYGHNMYHDWKPFSKITVTDAIVNSSNICSIKIGERVGSKGLAKTLADFGFGPGGTTEGFPEAIAGDVPSTDQLTEEEYVGLIATGYTIQAGFNITPLEIIQAYGAIANGGKLMKPLSAKDADSAATVVRQVLSSQTSHDMRTVLQKVVQEGTGRLAQSRIYTTAGKTGTAYTPGSPEHDTLGGERAIASFAGFAPVNSPRLAVYVGIIDPTNSKDHNPHGNEHAAPIFREVTERTLQYLNVAPDRN